MKQFIFVAVYLLVSSTAISQITKGNFLIGGNISLESIENKSANSIVDINKTTNLSIAPKVGYFIIDKLAGGLRLDYKLFKQKAPNDGITQANYSLSPFARYYFLPQNNKVNILADMSYIFSRSKFTAPFSSGYIQKAKGYYISAGPAMFLTNQISLEFLLGYWHTKTNDVYKTKSTIFNSTIGLQIHLGNTKSKEKS